jgi:ABC-type nitrate/sulfonate/bicarbonate transport system permease component
MPQERRTAEHVVPDRTPGWQPTVLAIAMFLVLWEIVGHLGLVPSSLFPPPTQVAGALGEMARSSTRPFPAWTPAPLQSDLLWDTLVSSWRAILGWAIGSAVGIIVGITTGRVRSLNAYLGPIIQLFRPLPPVAIIPIVIVWFGIGETSKLFSIAFAVFFPVWINAHLGAQKIPQSFIWSASSLGSRGWRTLTRVILPGALPFIVAGLRTGIAVSFVMVYVSELAGASAGIGYEISTSHLAYRVDRMMAALLVLGGLGAGSDWVLNRALYRVCPWLRYVAR